MIKLYHGTTTEAYRSILKNGFCHKDVVWTCSDSDMLYFYSDELIAKEFELDEQEVINKCFEMALQSASFSAAVTNSTFKDLFVFEFLIDEEYRYIIKTDGSMKKSSECSVCIEANLLKKFTHNIYCAPEHYTSRLAIFYLSTLEPDYLPELNLSRFEKKMMEHLIPLYLDLFQSELADFFSEQNIILLHENVCINDISSFKYQEQEDAEVINSYDIKLEM